MRQSHKIARPSGAVIVSLLLLSTTSVAAGSSSNPNLKASPATQGDALVSFLAGTPAVPVPATPPRPPWRHRPRLVKLPKPHLSTYERLRRRIPAWFRAGLNRLGQCENSGRYQTVSQNGFYGRYQFDRRTWEEELKYHNDPENASPAQQDWAAYRLYRKRRTEPWPECGHLLLG